MRPVVWKGWIIDYEDALAFLRGEKNWDSTKRREVRFLVDTGALRTIIPSWLLEGLKPLYLKEVSVQGVCDKPSRFMLVHLGIAISIDGKPLVSIHGVLIPLEEDVEKSVARALEPYNVDAILGLISMDELHITIDEKTQKIVA